MGAGVNLTHSYGIRQNDEHKVSTGRGPSSPLWSLATSCSLDVPAFLPSGKGVSQIGFLQNFSRLCLQGSLSQDTSQLAQIQLDAPGCHSVSH